MAGIKIYHLFLVIITAQSILCKTPSYTTEELELIEELKSSSNITEKFKYMIIENLMLKPQKYITSAANAIQYMLKDETLQANIKPEVIEFKKNLTQYLDKHAPSMDNIQSSYVAMIDFEKMVNQYFELSEKDLTPESKLIIDLLKKYNCKNIAMNMSDHYEKFLQDFDKLFEENKSKMEKPLLDWYDQYMKATYFSRKMSSIIMFFMMS